MNTFETAVQAQRENFRDRADRMAAELDRIGAHGKAGQSYQRLLALYTDILTVIERHAQDAHEAKHA